MSSTEKLHFAHADVMQTAAVRASNRYAKILEGQSFEVAVDIGCAAGDLLLQINAKHRVGVDFDESQLAKAKEKGITTVHLDLNSSALPFESSSIDLFVCNDVFEHLIMPESLLAEIHRCLKPGGQLLTHVSNEFRWKNIRKLLKGQGFQDYFPGTNHWDYPHLRFFAHSSFRRFLETGKLDVVADHTIKDRIVHRLGPLFWWGPTYLCKKP